MSNMLRILTGGDGGLHNWSNVFLYELGYVAVFPSATVPVDYAWESHPIDVWRRMRDESFDVVVVKAPLKDLCGEEAWRSGLALLRDLGQAECSLTCRAPIVYYTEVHRHLEVARGYRLPGRQLHVLSAREYTYRGLAEKVRELTRGK